MSPVLFSGRVSGDESSADCSSAELLVSSVCLDADSSAVELQVFSEASCGSLSELGSGESLSDVSADFLPVALDGGRVSCVGVDSVCDVSLSVVSLSGVVLEVVLDLFPADSFPADVLLLVLDAESFDRVFLDADSS